MNASGSDRYARVRAITFDAAHTLFFPNPSVGAIYREVMARHALLYPEAALESGFREAFATEAKDLAILDGEARERAYWQRVVAASIAALEPQPTDFEALFEDLWNEFALGRRWRVADGARETLQALRGRGYATALLTNWDSRVRRVLAETGVGEDLDAIIVSSDVGAEKPDRAIFAAAERALGLAPDALLHVGDSLQHDVRGALDAGWQAIRILDSSERAETEGVTSIRSLAELLDLL